MERAAALPGVGAAGLINRLPVRDGGWQGTVRAEDRPDLDGERSPNSFWRAVTPGTFAALGVEMVEGRGILASDGPDAPRVAVVNESFARTMWGERTALGRRISGGGRRDGWYEVVGVVRNVAVDDLVGERAMAMYLSWDQVMRSSEYGLLVLKATDPLALVGAARALVSQVDDRATVGRVETMTSAIDRAIATPLRLRFFLTLFSALAIALGTVGIYGVVSYAVQRRRTEFGVRLALGARPGQLLAVVVRTGMPPVVLGVTGGLAAALLATAALERFLFQVSPTDLASLAGAAVVPLTTGVLAAVVPAYRASTTHPAVSLRGD